MINVVIPAAGEGTRLRPLSSNVSKAMVPVNGKPTIAYIIEQIEKLSEVNEIVIVDGKFDDIREFTARYDNVTCVKQGSLNGPRDAIAVGCGELKDPNLPLVVWLGDAIILDDSLKLGEDFVLTTFVEDQSAWCMYDGDKFYNKPKESIPTARALVGLYSFKEGWDARHHFINSTAYDISDAIDAYCADFNIKMESVHTNFWYDIGELRTYYKTCAELLNRKARAFNSFEYNPDLNVISKKSEERPEDILLEKNWYSSINEEQKLFVPRVYNRGPWLNLSYEPGTLVSDLFLFGDLSEGTTKYILEKVIDVMDLYFHNDPNTIEQAIEVKENARELWVTKSYERLAHPFFGAEYFNEDEIKALMEIANDCADNVIPVEAMHGDLHGGNILYNSQNDHIIFIDPRGGFGNLRGAHGDGLYDYAKLAHDFYHGYGEIVNEGSYNPYVKEAFKYHVQDKVFYDLIIDAGILLIATCVPLHKDAPQCQKKLIEKVKTYLHEENRI